MGQAQSDIIRWEQLAADGPPDLLLGLGVGDARRRLAGSPGEGRCGDLVAAAEVVLVVGAGMVVSEVDRNLTALTLGDR